MTLDPSKRTDRRRKMHFFKETLGEIHAANATFPTTRPSMVRKLMISP
jgi:hypothetical protein